MKTDATLDLTSALADPTRYGIYQAVLASAGEPVTVATIAARFSLHPNVARMHLQKLVDAGLLQSDTQKPMGGGRPARTYRVSPHSADLSFPPRDYRLLASAFLRVLERMGSRESQALEEVGREIGLEEGAGALRRQEIDLEQAAPEALVRSLETTCRELGLSPRVVFRAGAIEIDFTNCVFSELSSRNPELVCRFHRGMLKGVLDAYHKELSVDGSPGLSVGESSCHFVVSLPGTDSRSSRKRSG